MKRVMCPVDMIVWFDSKGGIHPTRFRIIAENEAGQVIAVDRATEREAEKFGGNLMRVFECVSTGGGRQRRLQLKYEIRTCLWYLDKIE